MTGKLYLVGTPIGNLEDMTYRAIRILKEVDLIAAEDTRHTGKLLTHFEINTPSTSYHEHNEKEKSSTLIEKLLQGKDIALVTDAGMPTISDPGYRLVSKIWENNLEVITVPGPTALISALAMSGMPTDRFSFEGFLPRKKRQRESKLQELITETRTMIFYEAPHRLLKALKSVEKVFGVDRVIMVARELTKKHEEKIRGKVGDVIAHFEKNQPKGELVIVINGSNPEDLKEEKLGWEDMTVLEHLYTLIDAGLTKKQAIKKVAKERDLPKKQVYKTAIQIEAKKRT